MPVVGVAIGPGMTGVLGLVGHMRIDFALVDAERHYLTDSAEQLVRVADAAGIATIFTVPRNDPPAILRYLETGASGVEVPGIRSAADAEAAVQAVKYYPRGRRGLAAVRSAQQGALVPMGEYIARANERTVVMLRLESVSAIDAIPEIVAVEDVDVLHFDVALIRRSMGPQTSSGAADAAVAKAVERIASSGRRTAIAAAWARTDRGTVLIADPLDWVREGARSVREVPRSLREVP